MSLPNGYQIPAQNSAHSQSSQTMQNNMAPPSSLAINSSMNPTGPHPTSALNDSPINSAPMKRGPGRPKGSTNKNKPPAQNPDGTPIQKRPVGRPRKEVDPNAPVKPKNPVGRPRKHPVSGTNPPVVVTPVPVENNAANVGVGGLPGQQNANLNGPNAINSAYPQQQLSGNTSNATSNRLLPSPTVTPSSSAQMNTQVWTGGTGQDMLQVFHPPSPNGLVGRSVQPSPATNSVPIHPHNAPSGTTLPSPQSLSFDTLGVTRPDPLVPNGPSTSTEQRPVSASMNAHNPNATLSPPRPKVLTSLNSRPTQPQPMISALNTPTVGPSSSSQTTPTVPRFTNARHSVSHNWKQLEAAVWNEVQQLNLVDHRLIHHTSHLRDRKSYTFRGWVPSSVFTAYKEHLEELRRETPARCPDAYTILNSFWLPVISPYFQLTTSRSSYSSALSDHRFFYWDPMYLLVGGIPCPSCSFHLTRDGFFGPYPVIHVGNPFYLIGQIYKCPNCSRKPSMGTKSAGLYLSWDSDVLKSLPPALAQEFPAELKPCGVVSKELNDLVQASAKAGIDAKQLGETIRGICKPNIASGEDISVELEPLPSPNTAPSSPELPERQRTYYRAWHRNGRLPDSLAPSNTSSKPPDSGTFHDDDASGEIDPVALETARVSQNQTPSDGRRAVTGVPPGLSSSATDKPNPTQNPNQNPNHVPSTSKPAQNGNNNNNNKSQTPAMIGAAPGAVMPPMFFVPTGNRGPHPSGMHFFQTANGPAVPVASVASMAPYFPSAVAQDTLRRSNPYAEESPPHKKRRVRHCAKCGSETCKGRGGGSNCPNPCRDCGKMDCKGRSSTKPGRLCDNRASAQIAATQE